jgi:hypothetical protein
VEILQKDGNIPQQWAINQVEQEKKASWSWKRTKYYQMEIWCFTWKNDKFTKFSKKFSRFWHRKWKKIYEKWYLLTTTNIKKVVKNYYKTDILQPFYYYFKNYN